ncbi:hypothetical protein Tco_0153582 [Tanacetum coccineum]
MPDIGSPRVDGPPVMSEDPYAYVVAAFQAPPSPDYVPGLELPEQAPLSPEFVPEPVYPEFMPLEDEVFPAEEQPLPSAVSPTADSPGYIANSDSEEDEEDPEEDPTDYPVNGGDDDDGDDESSDDDEDDDDDDVEEDEDEEDEEEHPAPATLSHHLYTVLQLGCLSEMSHLYHFGLRAYVAMIRAAAPSTYILAPRSETPPLETPPSGTPPLLPIPLPTPSPPLILPLIDHRANRREVGKSSSAPTARPTGGFRADYGFVATLDDEITRNPKRYVGYRITDTWDDMVEDMQGTPAVTDVAGLNDAHDDRLFMSGWLNMLHRDRRAHAHIALFIGANGADIVYMSFGAMVNDFTREDLIELYRTMVDPPLNEDVIWSLPLQQKMYCTKALATPEQTATGKENPNPLIADSLLKTISCEEKTKTKRQNLSKATNPLQAKELLQIKEMADQDTPPPTITAMKIPIIKKGEYDIWSMRMRQYICHTDHNLWDIIVNGDLEDEATPSGEQSSPPVPKTAKQLAARRNQERIKSILLLAIPDEYLLKFHNVPDAKSLWAAIKSRFGGNEESKKMQKNVLKHQFENFVTASNETLDKAYDRFQKLISQLEIHGAYVSKEDINQKFLRSLPPSWSQIALIMRNKPDIDEVDIDDLYNNLRVYEDELKRSSGSNSASQNLAFLSSENTNSTNEVSTASGDFGVSTAGGINQVPSTPSAHDIAYSFLAQPTTSPQLENKDFQQMDGDHLEELDLRWQVAMLTIREKKFIQRTGRNMDFKEKRHVSLDKSKIKCYNYGLGGYDWSNDFEVEPVNYALITISSSSSSSSSDSESKINRNEVIIEDWTSDDEDDVCAVKTVSSVKPNSPEPRVKNVVNTAERVVKPVWDYGKRVNHQKISKKLKYPHAKRTFNPSAVLTRVGLVNTDRSNVSTDRSISTVRTVRPVYTVKPVSTARPLRSYFTQPVYRPKDLKPNMKTFGVNNMTTVGTRAVVSKGKVENVLKKAKWGESRDLDTSIMHVDSEVIPKERAVNTACYVLNRPFGCPLTILNTLDSLGKFDGKSDEGYLLGYSTSSKAFRVIMIRVDKILMLQDAQAQTSKNASPDKDIQDSEDVFDKEGQHQMPEDEQVWQDELEMMVTQELVANAMNDESRQAFEEEKRKICTQNKALKLTNASNTLPNDGIFNGAYDDDEDVGAVADFQNMDNTIAVSPIPTLRIHNDHPKGQILGDPISAVQTRGKIQKAYFSTTKP